MDCQDIIRDIKFCKILNYKTALMGGFILYKIIALRLVVFFYFNKSEYVPLIILPIFLFSILIK